ncbi:MAG: hypothetical protein V4685_11760 [Bacteroidota bacterium]
MFDDIIKGKANEHEAPVPPDAWDNIAKKKKKRRFAFWWWSSALLLVLALSTVVYLLLNKENGNAIAKTDEANSVKTGQKLNESKEPVNEIKKDSNAEATLPLANKDITVMTEKNNIPAKNIGGEQQRITITGKSKTKITTTNAVTEESEIKVAGSNKQIKKIKGKLKAQQANGEAEELIAVNNNEKTNNNESIIPTEEKEEPAATQEKEIIAAKTVDVKPAPVIEEKKTTAIEANKTDNKKTSPVVAKKAVKKHWFFEAGAIPLIAASQYNENSSFYRNHVVNNSVSVYKANLVNASIEPAVAFSLLIRREVSKKIAVGTGLQYMLLKENMSIEGKETNTTYAFVDRLVNGQLVPDTIATITEGARAISAVNSYQLFSIPLFVQYSIIQKPKWSLDAVGGLYFNISGNYKNEINRNAAAPLLAAPGTTNKSNTGMDLFAGIRIGKKLSKRLDFFAMPSMRWSLAKYNVKNSLLDKNINQAGIGFGLGYKIN